MALGSTQPLTEMCARNLLEGAKGPRHVRLKISPPSVSALLKTWEPRRLTNLWASTVCYEDSFKCLWFSKQGK
jgi:hypothetical protein